MPATRYFVKIINNRVCTIFNTTDGGEPNAEGLLEVDEQDLPNVGAEYNDQTGQFTPPPIDGEEAIRLIFRCLKYLQTSGITDWPQGIKDDFSLLKRKYQG